MIVLADALQAMQQMDRRRNLEPFSIEFVTWNERGDRCGRLIRYEKAVVESLVRGKSVKPGNWKRDPNHWRNFTRNIRQLGTDQITKVHIFLITQFNDMPVKWFIHG